MSQKLFIWASACLAAAVSAFADITIDPPSRTFTKDGGGGSILTSGSGTWNASTAAGWITITPRTSGDAGVSCVYVVSANFSADVRSGVITIAGQTHTVTQTGYPSSLSPSSASVPLAGAGGTVAVTVESGVAWSAAANAAWLSVSPASGMGPGAVSWTAQPYGGVVTRTGSITIAGKTFAVTQTGVDVNIAPYAAEKEYGADIIQIAVTALATTTWTVAPNASWISVIDGGNGFGDSIITLAVGQNPSFVPRTGTVSIGSMTFTVTQKGMSSPSLAIIPETAGADATGAYGNVAVLATPDAPWTAESLSPWITLASGTPGAGNGNVQYVASANPTLANREGRIKFTPPVYEPEIDLYAGLIIRNDSTNTFTGNASKTFSGTTIAAKDRNDFALAFRFKLTELNAVNRLLQFNGHSLYVNTDNRIVFDDLLTGYTVPLNAEQSIVLLQTADGTVKLFAGSPETELALIGTSAMAALKDFTASDTPATAFVFGTGTLPTSGYLTNGQISYLRVWGRALSDREAIHSDITQYAQHFYESAPNGAPASIAWEHFTFGGNVYHVGSANSVPNLANTSLSGNRWAESTGRSGLRQRAMFSSSASGSYPKIVNSSMPCSPPPPPPPPSTTHYTSRQRYYTSSSSISSSCGTSSSYTYNSHYHYSNASSVGGTGSFFSSSSLTWSGWVKFDSLPGTVFTTSDGMVVTLSANADGSFTIVHGNTTSTFFTLKVKSHTWHHLSVRILGATTLSLFIDGAEAGNVPTNVSATLFNDSRVYCALKNTIVSGAITTNITTMTVGGFEGAIDEMTFFADALASAQIKALYDAQKPLVVYHTVTQGAIDPVVGKTLVAFGSAGGSTNVALTVAQNVNWNAVTETEWVSLTSAGSGAGSSVIAFDVAANPHVAAREGAVTVAGKTITVRQAGLDADVFYNGTIFGTDGGLEFVDVTTQGNALWTASSDVPWMEVLDTAGNGSGSVMFVVDPTTSTQQSRTGTLTIAGKKVYVTQRGYTLSISPQIAQIGSNAGAGEFGVAAPIDAVWTALVTEPWITLIGGNTGLGNGTLRYTVTDNATGQTRTGRIIVAGQTYTITQLSTLTLDAEVEGEGTVAGTGTYQTGIVATLTATPASGYAFSHWTGDIVGVSNITAVTMDTSKTVTAHFVPEEAALRMAAVYAQPPGENYYTEDQIRDLNFGFSLVKFNAQSGTLDLDLHLQEKESLTVPDWSDLPLDAGKAGVNPDGTVRLQIAPQGNTRFYRLRSVAE